MRAKLRTLFLAAQDQLEAGNAKLAFQTYTKALAEAEKETLEEYIATNFLGMACDDLDEFATARKHFRRCEDLAIKLYGEASIEYAISIGNEGMLFLNRMKNMEAEQFFDRAIAILRKAKPGVRAEIEVGMDTAQIEVYANAAECKARLGKLNLAMDLMKNAYDESKTLLDPCHPRRLQAAMELQMLYERLGKKAAGNKLKDDVIESMLDSGANPISAMGAFIHAFAKFEQMSGAGDVFPFGDFDDDDHVCRPIRKRGGAANKTEPSNVVSLFGHEISEPKHVNCDGEVDPDFAAYQLKISLKGVKPPIWRRVIVPADMPLNKLHSVIQEAMGWTDTHLHEFYLDDIRFGDDPEMGEVEDEGEYSLESLDLTIGEKLDYVYDFGDGWEHTIKIEKVLNLVEYEASDVFVTGKGACPPEDCGGPWGYMELLELIAKVGVGSKKLPMELRDFDPLEMPSCFPAKNTKAKSKAKLKKVAVGKC